MNVHYFRPLRPALCLLLVLGFAPVARSAQATLQNYQGQNGDPAPSNAPVITRHVIALLFNATQLAPDTEALDQKIAGAFGLEADTAVLPLGAAPVGFTPVDAKHFFAVSRVSARNFVATASCGICGKASLDDIQVRCRPIPDGPLVTPETLLSLPGRLRAAQDVFTATGGLHAAGLFDAAGTLLAIHEDVGRHNALDKLVGGRFLAGELPLNDRIVLVSGRTSFELVQKAAIAGVPILAAVSAPSDLAVEAAERLGVTLVGFLRADGFNVYARPDRIATGQA